MSFPTREAAEEAGYQIGDRVIVNEGRGFLEKKGTVVGIYHHGGWWIGVKHDGEQTTPKDDFRFGASNGYMDSHLTLFERVLCPKCDAKPIMLNDYLCERCRYGCVAQ
jgi:hypothetical protein